MDASIRSGVKFFLRSYCRYNGKESNTARWNGSEISDESGSTLIRGLVMDQLDLAQVSSASKEFLSWALPLHGLLLNAGVFGGGYSQSAQEHETGFQKITKLPPISWKY